MPNERDEFAARVMECAVEITERMPEMVARFEPLVLVRAFAQHVGGALHLLMRRQLCDAQRVRRMLRRIEAAAFHDPPK